jgi:hypothetical protein
MNSFFTEYILEEIPDSLDSDILLFRANFIPMVQTMTITLIEPTTNKIIGSLNPIRIFLNKNKYTIKTVLNHNM